MDWSPVERSRRKKSVRNEENDGNLNVMMNFNKGRSLVVTIWWREFREFMS